MDQRSVREFAVARCGQRALLGVALGALVVLSTASCAPRPTQPVAAPVIVRFAAEPARVAPGGRVELSWETHGATALELRDGAGVVVFAAPPTSLAASGAQAEGGVSADEAGSAWAAAPHDVVRAGAYALVAAREAVYTLWVAGPGGSAAATVRVGVEPQAPAASLVALPEQIAAGATAQLHWSVSGDGAPVIRASTGELVRLEGSRGLLDVRPLRTTSYVLTLEPRAPRASADGARTAAAAEATVAVEPRVARWSVEPASVLPGEELSLSWETRGATRLELTEASLGLLAAIDAPAQGLGELFVGSRRFVVPADVRARLGQPGEPGEPREPGAPPFLRFRLRASGAGAAAVESEALVSLGGGPLIERLEAPEAVTEGERFRLAWRTVGAERLRVLLDGAAVFATQPRESDRVREGELWLPAPAGPRRYELEAVDAAGVRVTRVARVRPVPAPRIDAFVLPAVVDEGGLAVTARWRTQGAERLRLALKGGPTLARVDEPREVVAGRLRVRPGCTQIYVLEASNAAGAVATAERRVHVERPLARLEPWPAARRAPLSVTWQLSGLGVREVVGLPSPVAHVVDSDAFVDARGLPGARALGFDDVEGGAAQVPPMEGFAFPFGARLRQRLWVSVDGFVAFEAPRAGGARIAPFWDDLVLGPRASVHVALVPSSERGQRRLLVQWSELERAGQHGSALTFQVQLEESGLVRFAYGALVGEGASGEGAKVGVWDDELELAQELPTREGVPRLRAGDEVRFFAGAPPDGSLPLSSAAARWLHFFGRTDDELVPLQLFVAAFNPGELSISEVMPVTDPTFEGDAQWIELRNRLDVDVDLGGLVLGSASGEERAFTFAPGTLVPPGGFLLLGRSRDPERTAGVTPQVLLRELPPLQASDTLWLGASSAVVDALEWTGAELGVSVLGGDQVLSAPNRRFVCARTASYGTWGYRGTPGAPNEACAPYHVESIPSDFVELGADGSGDRELLGSESIYSGKATYELPRPFTYFGRSFGEVHVSVGGFLAFGDVLGRAYETVDDARPSSSAPNGVVAVFWDELYRRSPGRVWMRRAEDRTVVSWQDFGIFSTDARLSFQAHLLDTGVVELHYGAMLGNGDEERVSGSSAAAWLEALDGTFAVPVSVQRPGGLAPFTSYRLTPTR